MRKGLLVLLLILLSPLLAGFLALYAPRNIEFSYAAASSFADHPQLQHAELRICSPATSAGRNLGDINSCDRERDRTCPADTIHIAASFVRPPAGAAPTGNHNATIVVVHGHGSHRHRRMGRQWSIVEKAVVPLAQAGYNVLAIDLRNHGASDTYGPVTFGVRESLDVAAAVEYAQTCLSIDHGLDGDRVGLYAESMGAASSLIAVGQHGLKDLRALWSEGSYTTLRQAILFRFVQGMGLPNWFVELVWMSMEFLGRLIANVKLDHADPLSFIPFIEVPVTISHGDFDRVVSYQQGQQIWEAARVASELTGKPPVVEAFWYHGHHTEAYLDNRMPAALISFFEKYV